MANLPLTLAYSPCPNDTYIFAALANRWLPDSPTFELTLADVEALNNEALKAMYDVTKVSYAVVPQLSQHYKLLRSGGALGYNCGPLLVAPPGNRRKLKDFRDATIAIPGTQTTAFLLLRLALQHIGAIKEIRFDHIARAVKNGEADAGVIIHEARFTYKDAGLVEIADFGEWWTRETGLPIPLGAIVARNALTDDQTQRIEQAIRASLRFARAHEDQALEYVRQSTRESDAVIRKHIALYVNEFSEDIGRQGEGAVRELFARASTLERAEAAEARFA